MRNFSFIGGLLLLFLAFLTIPASAAFSHSQAFKVFSGADLIDQQIKITLSNSSGSSSSGLTIFTNGDTQQDWEDIRFYLMRNNQDQGVSCSYWLDYKNQTANTITAYVKMPYIFANDTAGLKMVYGDASASSGMSGANTFEYFDDFSTDTSADYLGFGTNVNVAYNSTSEALMQTNNSKNNKYITTVDYFDLNSFIVEARSYTFSDIYGSNLSGVGVDITATTYPTSAYLSRNSGNNFTLSRVISGSGTVLMDASNNGVFAPERWVLYTIKRDRTFGVIDSTMAYGNLVSKNSISDDAINSGRVFGFYSYGCCQQVDDIRVMKYTDTVISLSSIQELQAPTADFSASVTTGESSVSTTFSDLSQNSPTVWSWTFGDGATSRAQNPSHTYSTVGTFTVSLTVSNAAGTDTETKTGYITVSAPPDVAPASGFTCTFEGVAPVMAVFKDHSTGTVDTYSWDFGDGNTSTEKNPKYHYNAVGNYTVTLTTIGPLGTSTTSQNVTVTQLINVSLSKPVATPIEVRNNSKAFNDIRTGLVSWNSSLLLGAVTMPFTDLIGNYFWVIVILGFLVYTLITYGGKATVPTVVVLLFGALIIGLFPAQWHYILWMGVVLGVASAFYNLIRSKN